MKDGNLSFDLPFHTDWEKGKMPLLVNWVVMEYFWDKLQPNVFLQSLFSVNSDIWVNKSVLNQPL